MTGKERIKAALEHREGDRVPFDLGATKMSGIAIKAYQNLLQYMGWGTLDPEPKELDRNQRLAELPPAVLQKLGVDTRGVFASPPKGGTPTLSPFGKGYSFIDEWGIGWRIPEKEGLYYDLYASPFTGEKTVSQAEAYPWPDARDPSRFANISSRLQEIAAEGEFGITMHSFTSGVMEMFLRLRGFEDGFSDLLTDPELACYLLDQLVELKMCYWEKALKEADGRVDVVVEPDDLGTQSSLLISCELYRSILMPRHKRLFSFIKQCAPNVKIFLHSCGAIFSIIPDLIEAGVDILNPVQVSASGMDTKKLKREYGRELVFWGGGVDTQRVLPYGTPEEVRDEVRRRIDDLAPGGGFVFNTVHNIQADVPPQNLAAMLETLEEYGIYESK